MAHLAYMPAPAPESKLPATAEFGVSVAKRARVGAGYGARLFEHAVLHARNRGCERLFIQCTQAENTAMLKIARNAGCHGRARRPGVTKAWLKRSAAGQHHLAGG